MSRKNRGFNTFWVVRGKRPPQAFPSSIGLYNALIKGASRKVNIGRSEAIDLINSWSANRKALRCFLDFRKFAAGFDCKVFSISDRDIRFVSDTNAEMTLHLNPSVEFGFGHCEELKDYAATHERYVMVFPDGLMPVSGHVEKIVLLEHKDTMLT